MPKNMMTKLGIGLIVLIFAGCASAKNSTKGQDTAKSTGGGVTTRAYIADKERVDQEMQGNYGYLQGTPVAPDRSNVKKTRKVYVVEVTKDVPENIKETNVSKTSTASLLPPDLQERPKPVAPRRKAVVIPRIDDEPVAPKAEKMQAAGSTEEQEYTIGKNDTLQKISKKFYGSYAKWNKIYEANKNVIKDPNRIKSGTVIRIPVLD